LRANWCGWNLIRFRVAANDGKDRYSRTLAYIFLQDGTHLNAEIIRQGYGFAVSGSPPLKYQEKFRQLEREAREQRRGL
jgi:micrococcal nuclease